MYCVLTCNQTARFVLWHSVIGVVNVMLCYVMLCTSLERITSIRWIRINFWNVLLRNVSVRREVSSIW